MRLPPKAALLVAGIHASLFLAVPAHAQEGDTTPAPAPAPAKLQPATPAGQDVIYLKGGGLLRGTIIDAIPGAQARIQLATGEIATVPWADIDRIAQAEQAPVPAPVPVPAPPPRPTPKPAPAPAPARSTGSVTLHIDGADGAQLQMSPTGHDDWKTICDLPCDASVPAGSFYRVMGEDMRPSPDFQLQAGAGGHETIHVKPASKGAATVGAILGGGGGIAAYIGFLVALSNSGPFTTPEQQRTQTAGWITVAAGLGACVAGVLIALNNTKTTVAQDVDARAAAQLDDQALRRAPSPTWRDASPVDRAAPPVLGVPLLTGSF